MVLFQHYAGKLDTHTHTHTHTPRVRTHAHTTSVTRLKKGLKLAISFSVGYAPPPPPPDPLSKNWSFSCLSTIVGAQHHYSIPIPTKQQQHPWLSSTDVKFAPLFCPQQHFGTERHLNILPCSKVKCIPNEDQATKHSELHVTKCYTTLQSAPSERHWHAPRATLHLARSYETSSRYKLGFVSFLYHRGTRPWAQEAHIMSAAQSSVTSNANWTPTKMFPGWGM
jgi:hypothetical protein